tara:strand:+ start:9295 stop:9606 length:312 start_codon:yes stop_codon:yes gene_type:complete
MGEIIDFKTKKSLEVDDTNVIVLRRDRMFKVKFFVPGNSVTMDRNEYNDDISLSIWKEEVEGELEQLGVAIIPAEDIDEAAARLNELVAFTTIEEIVLIKDYV